VVIVGDLNKERLEQAHSFGCETVEPVVTPAVKQPW
jgi:hypothetical protein